MPRTLRILLLSLVLGACAQAGQTGGRDTNVISEAEIDASGGTTAYDVIQKVRSNFLSDRGKTTLAGAAPNKPSVFVDGVHFGEISALRNVSARQLASIRLYRAWEAQQKYGSGFVGGVIELTTRK
jgi:outer membrane cobalamin receptor